MQPRVVLQSYRGLVVQEAWKAWRQLPKQTRAWIGLDDLIEMGTYFVWNRTKKWSASGGASFGSYVKKHLPYYFANKVGQPFGMSQKRSEINTVSIQALELSHAEHGQDNFQIESLIENYYSDLTDIGTAELILKLYDDASPTLKSQLIKWFLETDKTKVHVTGAKFKICRREFRKLAKKYSLTIDECRFMFRSPVCLDLLSRQALGVPYNLDEPTPGFRSHHG